MAWYNTSVAVHHDKTITGWPVDIWLLDGTSYCHIMTMHDTWWKNVIKLLLHFNFNVIPTVCRVKKKDPMIGKVNFEHWPADRASRWLGGESSPRWFYPPLVGGAWLYPPLVGGGWSATEEESAQNPPEIPSPSTATGQPAGGRQCPIVIMMMEKKKISQQHLDHHCTAPNGKL